VLGSLVPPAHIRTSGVPRKTKKRTAIYHRQLFLNKVSLKNLLLMENNVSIYKELSCLETEEKKRTTIHPGRLLSIRFYL
jgi:hypothetical protein